MPKDQKDKFSRVLESIIDGLSEFATIVDDLSKQSNMMLKLLSKSVKELKGIRIKKGTVVIEEEVVQQAAKPILGIKSRVDVREKAASLLFNMLSTKPGSTIQPQQVASSVPPKSSGPPSGPPKSSGPPSGPPKRSGPPSGPPKRSGPPSKPGLPPPPKLPPTPKGSSTSVKVPSFVKGTPPKAPGSPPPLSSPPSTPPTIVASGGSSLGSLRDEMLKELDRLKKIMRGG